MTTFFMPMIPPTSTHQQMGHTVKFQSTPPHKGGDKAKQKQNLLPT